MCDSVVQVYTPPLPPLSLPLSLLLIPSSFLYFPSLLPPPSLPPFLSLPPSLPPSLSQVADRKKAVDTCGLSHILVVLLLLTVPILTQHLTNTASYDASALVKVGVNVQQLLM